MLLLLTHISATSIHLQTITLKHFAYFLKIGDTVLYIFIMYICATIKWAHRPERGPHWPANYQRLVLRKVHRHTCRQTCGYRFTEIAPHWRQSSLSDPHARASQMHTQTNTTHRHSLLQHIFTHSQTRTQIRRLRMGAHTSRHNHPPFAWLCDCMASTGIRTGTRVYICIHTHIHAYEVSTPTGGGGGGYHRGARPQRSTSMRANVWALRRVCLHRLGKRGAVDFSGGKYIKHSYTVESYLILRLDPRRWGVVVCVSALSVCLAVRACFRCGAFVRS